MNSNKTISEAQSETNKPLQGAPRIKNKKRLWIGFILILLVWAGWIIIFQDKHSSDTVESASEKRLTMKAPVIGSDLKNKTKDVPDFSSIEQVRERKFAFFGFLLPAIQAENNKILQQREFLLYLQQKSFKGQALTSKEDKWLNELATYYRVEASDKTRLYQQLLLRVDEVPETLVLIQTANESGWGTSRFAQDARNFFGQWCWTKGCGIVPKQRGGEESHEVRLFASVEESVVSYIRNLNTHAAYDDLRKIRNQLRRNKQPVTATPLTRGLIQYSTRREAYVDELQQMIRVNQPIIDILIEEQQAPH